jgi:hypothetical protein
MSSNRDFRFTVEQIWLLQRLRGSGLSRDQIVAGLEDLDRLDGAGSQPQSHFSSFSNNLVNHISGNGNRPQSNGSDQSKSPTEATEAEKIPTSTTNSALPQTFGNNPGTAAHSALQKNLSQAAAALLKPIQPFSAMWAQANQHRVSNTGSLNPYAALGTQFNNINDDKDQPNFRRDEPDDLADEIDQIQRSVEHCERRNQHEVKEEIRIFTQRHHISQTAISKATHQAISQSYISQWLTSNITMGDAKRRIIYEWFCRQKRRLEGVYPGQATPSSKLIPTSSTGAPTLTASGPFSSLQSRLMNLQGGSSQLSATQATSTLPDATNIAVIANGTSPQSQSPIAARKPRQRIMWPIKCLQFLDVAFGKNPYPGAAERSQLVSECNRLLGDENRSVEINDCHVANWFRNRRKMKKVIDQTGPKSMEHFEELIEMQEGSNDGVEFEDQPRSAEDTGMVKTEPEARIGASPCALSIDEMETTKNSPKDSPDATKNEIAKNYSAIVQNSGVLRSALLPGYQANRSKIIQNLNLNGRMEA